MQTWPPDWGGGVDRPPPLHAACQQARKARRTCAAYTCACPSRMRAEGAVGASPPMHATRQLGSVGCRHLSMRHPDKTGRTAATKGGERGAKGNPKTYLVLHPSKERRGRDSFVLQATPTLRLLVRRPWNRWHRFGTPTVVRSMLSIWISH